MPKARKPSSVTDSDVGDTEVMVMRFVELLKDEGVLKTLRSALYPQALSDKLDKLTEIIAGLTSQLENKEIKITALEERVERLEGECDRLEQYFRRGNLRFSGIPETGEGADTTAKVVDMINTKMAFTPPPPRVSGGHSCQPQAGKEERHWRPAPRRNCSFQQSYGA